VYVGNVKITRRKIPLFTGCFSICPGGTFDEIYFMVLVLIPEVLARARWFLQRFPDVKKYVYPIIII
jgi:hypothetical protein